MIDQMGAILGILKIEETRRSEAAAVDDDGRTIAERHLWLSKHADQLIYAIGNGLALLGERMKHGRSSTFESRLTEQERRGVSG